MLWLLVARLLLTHCTDAVCTSVWTETRLTRVIETFTQRLRCEESRAWHADFYGFSVIPDTQDTPVILRKELVFTCEEKVG